MTSEPTLVLTWLGAARDSLAAHRRALDTINVFPVADSDTGTNMWLTVMEGLAFAAMAGPAATEGEQARAFERGAVLGARGNSGVILSQFLAGMLDSLAHEGGLSRADAPRMARALAAGSAAAFDAVGVPVDGTMVSVAAAAADAAALAASNAPGGNAPGGNASGGNAPGSGNGGGGNGGAADVVRAAVARAREALATTREVLPAAREAGVIDAGAWGLTLVLEALWEVYAGPHSLPPIQARVPGGEDDAVGTGGDGDATPANRGHGALPGGGVYEVMFVSGNTDPQGATPDDAPGAGWRELSAQLASMGDSVAVSGIRGLVQAHVHTNIPDDVVELADTLGSSQILVRHIGAARQRDTRTGMVALTRAPGLAAPLANTGAVVLVIPAQAGLTDREFSRAVRDAGEREVVVAAADAELRQAATLLAEGRTAPAVHVVSATHEAQVVAAATAFALLEPQQRAATAIDGAVRGCHTLAVPEPGWVEEAVRAATDADVLTVILPHGVDATAAHNAVRPHVSEDTDVQVYQGRHLAGGVLLGVERVP